MMAAFACCLLAAANASESELLFQGRNLEALSKPRTLEFTEIPKPEVWLSETSTAGLILGFVSLGIFLVFTMVKIVLDEYKRHVKYSADVKKAQALLRDSLDCDETMMRQLQKEFLEQEKRGGKPLANDDDVNLVN